MPWGCSCPAVCRYRSPNWQQIMSRKRAAGLCTVSEVRRAGMSLQRNPADVRLCSECGACFADVAMLGGRQ